MPGRAVPSAFSATCIVVGGAESICFAWAMRPSSTSFSVAARYPRRARTSTPGRFTRTLIFRYRPSSLPFVDV